MAAKPKRSAAGFTIIETLIVLAIAGFILLLVFDAIPALQRGSRNGQRRQDVATILRAVSHYELNNSGNFIDCGYSGQASCFTSTKLNLSNVKLTIYSQAANVVVHSEPVSTTLTSINNNPNTDSNTVYVYNHQLCTNNNQSSTAVGASYSDIVALYATETGAAPNSFCQQL